MNSTQPTMSGAQISRFSCLAVSPWMNESARFTPNTIVPANSSAALTHATRSVSQAHQRQPSCPGGVDHLQDRHVAAGVEEQAAGEVDAGRRGRVGGAELR